MAVNRNIRCVVMYDGTKYQGWQRLKNSDHTIQGKIENVLSKMTDEKIEVIGSGRTDAGVHARWQVCNFHTLCQKSTENIMDYMNKYLPEDIVVCQVEEVDSRFHSRFGAKKKTYVYRIWISEYPPVFERKYVHAVSGELNLRKMKEAALLFIGEHDFQGFCTRKVKKSTVRRIQHIDILREDNELKIVVTGNGFLYNMVRIMVGTLLEIGKGTLTKEAIIEALETKDRSKAGEKAPAKGLVLHDVSYETRVINDFKQDK